jgi:hypothetical protein
MKEETVSPGCTRAERKTIFFILTGVSSGPDVNDYVYRPVIVRIGQILLRWVSHKGRSVINSPFTGSFFNRIRNFRRRENVYGIPYEKYTVSPSYSKVCLNESE